MTLPVPVHAEMNTLVVNPAASEALDGLRPAVDQERSANAARGQPRILVIDHSDTLGEQAEFGATRSYLTACGRRLVSAASRLRGRGVALRLDRVDRRCGGYGRVCGWDLCGDAAEYDDHGSAGAVWDR